MCRFEELTVADLQELHKSELSWLPLEVTNAFPILRPEDATIPFVYCCAKSWQDTCNFQLPPWCSPSSSLSLLPPPHPVNAKVDHLQTCVGIWDNGLRYQSPSSLSLSEEWFCQWHCCSMCVCMCVCVHVCVCVCVCASVCVWILLTRTYNFASCLSNFDNSEVWNVFSSQLNLPN